MSRDFDWDRVELALKIEEESGYQNLKGNQYQFHEFLCLTFGQTPPISVSASTLLLRLRWLDTAKKFARYPQLTIPERRHLIAQTRALIASVKQVQQNQSPPSPPKDIFTQKNFPSLQIKKPPIFFNSSTISSLRLDDPVGVLKGVSVKYQHLLAKLGLETVRDLLFYYPRAHIDYARQVNIKDLQAGETVTVVGRVRKCECFSSPKNKKLTIFNLVLRDSTGEVKITRFYAGVYYSHRGWQEKMKRMYPQNAIVAASGLVKKTPYGTTLDNPEFEVLDSDGNTINSLKIGRLVPVYPLTEGLPSDFIRKTIMEAMKAIPLLEDPLPHCIKKEYNLMDLQAAIAQIHYPQNQEELAQARRRLVFDEFFYLQLGFLKRRQEQKQNQTATPFSASGRLIERLQEILPFSLTNAQKRVIEAIKNDLQSSTPMNRLLQGDVGSGKTIVAVFAILMGIQSGYQAALMAPTEVLAEQHYRKIVQWFNQLHLPVELLTGATKPSKRKQIYAQLESGELPLVIGTHALIQDNVKFRNLGLVVIDEQHRFGVQQRAKLLSKGKAPHVLSMTATPIPRTLALTLHGDLDVSQIDELPPGRQPITTKVLTGKQRLQAYELIKREVANGRQAYIILPLIEESEKLEVKAATREYERLSQKVFPDFRVGLLHGRMTSQEKEASLNAFRNNETQIIVSTTVVEVGVDVPNATVMLIENAERFGLSQLHQLRGRVGRGKHKSYCFLVTNSKTPETVQRLNILEQSQDGFFIAEMDLRLRGPGEVLGNRQSGLPDFALASLATDQDVLMMARNAAEKLVTQWANNNPENWRWERELARRHQKLMGGILT
ncbi:MAG: ATP-dependent DNA helicase RecG [Geminocystis sp.]|nr:ATP-dependent DNA helicase RecG [Geminocystis sp.]